MIESSCTDLTAVYAVLKNPQMVDDVLELYDAVNTFDIAIFFQGNQIQVKFPEEFSNTAIRHGELHIALNYLSLPGKKLFLIYQL